MFSTITPYGTSIVSGYESICKGQWGANQMSSCCNQGYSGGEYLRHFKSAMNVPLRNTTSGSLLRVSWREAISVR